MITVGANHAPKQNESTGSEDQVTRSTAREKSIMEHRLGIATLVAGVSFAPKLLKTTPTLGDR